MAGNFFPVESLDDYNIESLVRIQFYSNVIKYDAEEKNWKKSTNWYSAKRCNEIYAE